jgi:hypothetical protein
MTGIRLMPKLVEIGVMRGMVLTSEPLTGELAPVTVGERGNWPCDVIVPKVVVVPVFVMVPVPVT